MYGCTFEESKILNDPIHGHITLCPDIVKIIDTPQFQRLRNLKQLGVAYYVFPGASHNRFEHSICVYHLANKFIKRILRDQKYLDNNNFNIKCISIAGLCHDLGHGPFSHTFEKWINYQFPSINFHHEDISLKLFDYLIDDNQIDLNNDEIKLIKSLIIGDRLYGENKWIYDIVNNTRNSIDVDKFDYISRDCYSIGLKSSYDPSRLIEFSHVINNEICFNLKETYNIYEMFHTRYSLFKQIYTHRVIGAIEHMLFDIFKESNNYLKIENRLFDQEEYLKLNDNILHEIEISNNYELKNSRELLKKLRRRELYKIVAEVIVDTSEYENFIQSITPQSIYDCKDFDDDINKENIIIDTCECNYGMKNQNPVNNVNFYSKYDKGKSININEEKITLLIPKKFSEKIVRVYSKDKNQVRQIYRAFKNLLRRDDLKKSSNIII